MEKMQIARHESGHALAAHLQGFRVDCLMLDQDGGQVFHNGPGDLLESGTHPIDVALKCGIVAVAGAVVSDVPMSGSDNLDLERALWLADFDRRWFYVDRAAITDLARELLEDQADKLDRVAGALVERGRLSGDEFRELLA